MGERMQRIVTLWSATTDDMTAEVEAALPKGYRIVSASPAVPYTLATGYTHDFTVEAP
jgi:hypothetical protein